jgi:hypothetical protein
MVRVLELAVLVLEQGLLEVMVQETRFPLTKVLLLYVALLVPTLLPFTFHWYVGLLPALLATAVNVAFAPAQMVVAAVEMLTVVYWNSNGHGDCIRTNTKQLGVL